MLIFNNVSKDFGDSKSGIRNVNFQVDPGELVFITGNSGSGKTTIMRLLTKDYIPTDGEISIEDIDLAQVKPSNIHHLRRKIGVIFQDYKLLTDLNVWENISLPLYIVGTPQAEVEQRVTDLLRLVGLEDKANLFPTQLSGGEAQRVSIARALTTGPSIIFADEPTGNLDPETALAIASLLHKINTLGTTLLFATHNLDFIKKFKGSRHIHLEDGTIVLDTKTNTHTKVETNKKDTKNKPEDTVEERNELSEGEEIKQAIKKQEKKGFLSKLFGKKDKKTDIKV